LIREDTILKRVYARIYKNGGYTGDTSEVLLYDFSLQQGDTFTMTTPSNTYQHIVDAVSNISINGTLHKKWHMQAIDPNNQDYTIVEGIGCLGEPLLPYRPVLAFSASYWLTCFRNSDIGVWSHATWSTCLLGVDNPPGDDLDIRIFPNPAKGMITLEPGNSGAKKNTSIEIVDCFGRKMLELKPEPGKRRINIETDTWPPGVYNILIRNSRNECSSKKLIISAGW
jgi:hypothetical protein